MTAPPGPTAGEQSRLRRAWEWVKFPPPYPGPVLDGRVDGVAYLVAWLATLVHLSLAAFVFLLGLDQPWPIVSAVVSGIGTILLLTLVIVIHRRMGQRRRLYNVVIEPELSTGLLSERIDPFH